MTVQGEVTPEAPPATLRRAMGFRDLILFYLVTGFSLRWIAQAASAGPSAVVIWIIGALALYVPLVFTVLELSSRYPEEGGLYAWTRRAFGEFPGYLSGYFYWSSNLPYFPSLFYFTAANALFIFGHRYDALQGSSPYFIVFSLLALAVAVGLNVVGLNVGKWLHNIGAIGLWIPGIVLVGMGIAAALMFGSATQFTARSFVPSTHLKDIIFWSTIAFSLSGLESASMLGDEIEDARRNIPRALLIAGALITILYIASTVAMMLALPPREIQNMQGIINAITLVATRLGIPWIAAGIALLITVGGLGQAGAWFAAAGRLPFVIGLDRRLPRAFTKIHPKWGTPYVALLVQAAIAALFIFAGQAGTTVVGAYNVLVSMSVIAFFIPYLFMFGAMIKLQREPAGAEVIRVPGGSPVAIALAGIGFSTTTISIGLSMLPADDEPNKPLAVAKVIGLTAAMIAVGVGLYVLGRRKQ
ncbi:MAG: APC family permease [Gemmatimonadaceae bacterium]|nr:APC family permease [Gemmatimonadaceae bacterium]